MVGGPGVAEVAPPSLVPEAPVPQMPVDGPDVEVVAPPSPSNPAGFPPPLNNDFSEGFKMTQAEDKPPPKKPVPVD